MRLKDYFYLAAAAMVGLFGLIMVLGTVIQFMEGEFSVESAVFVFGLGVLPLVAAAWLTVLVVRGARRRGLEGLERQILQLAAASDGRLTPSQVAQSTRLTLRESKAFLDRLGVEGYCRLELADDGVLSYRFTS